MSKSLHGAGASVLQRLLALAVPVEHIALDPAPQREAARLLVVDRAAGTLQHVVVADLPTYVRSGDLWVTNSSAVVPALTWLQTAGGARAELLWLEATSDTCWRVYGQTSKLRIGGKVFGAQGLCAVVSACEGQMAELAVTAVPAGGMQAWFAAHGAMPLPPYIRKERVRRGRMAVGVEDRWRYQTVYAANPGSIAAPTAGLHFTPALLAAMRAAGATIAPVVLHVGPGTFAHLDPGSDPAAVQIPAEHAEIPAATAAAVQAAKADGRRVVAVGSTSMRALEGLWCGAQTAAGAVDVVIQPGRDLRVADALLTNFHLPHTSLRLMVAAVAGTELALAAYQAALAEGYRFYSYGDAMLIV